MTERANDIPIAITEIDLPPTCTDAPRVTPKDIEANIVAEHYFTAANGTNQVSDDMVSRFLRWQLPRHFYPDCHISFDREKASQSPHTWPTGTNLLDAGQTRAMLEHILQPHPMSDSMAALTFCVLILRNGTKIVGANYRAIDPAQHDADRGRKDAREDAIRQIWPLMGYELRSKLACPVESD